MTLSWQGQGRGWRPEGGEDRDWAGLQPGDLVALGRQVWAVTEARAVPVADWDDGDHRWHQATRYAGQPPEEWPLRPVWLIIRSHPGGGPEHQVRVSPYWDGATAWVLPPHYPVCASCGRPWPCAEIDMTVQVRAEAAELERLAGILQGCCWQCGGPVTARQRSVTFGGDNLLLPGAAPPAFHTRHGPCLAAARAYEEQWVKAGAGRRRRLACPGFLLRHADTSECTAGADCPGSGVPHLAGSADCSYEGEACPRCQAAARNRNSVQAVRGDNFTRN
jgi:hypothetical protein